MIMLPNLSVIFSLQLHVIVENYGLQHNKYVHHTPLCRASGNQKNQTVVSAFGDITDYILLSPCNVLLLLMSF